MNNSESFSFENTTRAFSSRTDKELRKIYLLFLLMKQEIAAKIGSFFLKSAIKLHFPVKIFLKNNIYAHFCAGENLIEVSGVVENLKKAGIKTLLDYGMEAGSSEESYDFAFDRIRETIKFAGSSPSDIQTTLKISAIAHIGILEKMQSGTPLTPAEHRHIAEVKRKLDKIGSLCMDKNVVIMIDAEESWIQDTIDAFAFELMMKYNQARPLIYNTIQMYRKAGPALLEDAIALSRRENFYLGVKIVRGAYMEKERHRASHLGYESPIFDSKAETDEAFDTSMETCLRNRDRVSLCCGSHNESSNMLLTRLMQQYKIDRKDDKILFSQLYGMSDHISYNLASEGYNVAKYIPYGPVENVIPYLLRRANENKSVAGQTTRELALIEKEMKRRGMKK
jgi:proline dehydrogenase